MYRPKKPRAFATAMLAIFAAFSMSINIDADKLTMSCSDETAAIETDVETYSDEEVTAIAMVLAGECYDDKLDDKRSVARVICNRVSDGKFGDTIIEVVSAKGQFASQGRPLSDSDIQIAKDILREWYANDREKLNEHLFFCAGPNRENVFRAAY